MFTIRDGKAWEIQATSSSLTQNYQVSRRFEMVAMDILEISPASDGYKKLLVIGDCLTRFMISVPIKNEEAKTVAEALFEKWISISDHQKNFLATEARRWLEEL